VLHYPDLVAPSGWSYFRVAAQVRLIPPGAHAETAEATIIISPLVPRTPALASPEKLIEEALDAEIRFRFEPIARGATKPVQAASGLAGMSLEVSGYARPRALTEKRIYVVYADDVCFYGINYLASDTGYVQHLDTFWRVARSVKPFRGRVVHPGDLPLQDQSD